MTQAHCFSKKCYEIRSPAILCNARAAGCKRDVQREDDKGAGAETTMTSTMECAREAQSRWLMHKYPDEGRSAVIHGTALAFPGARYRVVPDGTPHRIDIALPRRAVEGTAEGHLYFCKTCADHHYGPRLSACLSPAWTYHDPTLELAKKPHSCRYADARQLREICDAVGYNHTLRNAQYFEFKWFCGLVP